MGHISCQRCNLCCGTGKIDKNSDPSAMAAIVYEFVEGYLDTGTSNEWMEQQYKKLMKYRKQLLDGRKIEDDDLIDEDPD